VFDAAVLADENASDFSAQGAGKFGGFESGGG
jgi:hypothetical protein